MDLYRRASHLEEYALERMKVVTFLRFLKQLFQEIDDEKKKKKGKLNLNCCQNSMLSSGSTVVDWNALEKKKWVLICQKIFYNFPGKQSEKRQDDEKIWKLGENSLSWKKMNCVESATKSTKSSRIVPFQFNLYAKSRNSYTAWIRVSRVRDPGLLLTLFPRHRPSLTKR